MSVTVHGQILDPNGRAYALGRWEFRFVPGPTTTFQVAGQPTGTCSGELDSNGRFADVILGDTAMIGGGARWQATITSSAADGFVSFRILLNVTQYTVDL